MAQITGGCSCGHVRYRFRREPMIVHCCHCSWCQRETGSAFVLNALIETSEIDLEGGKPDYVLTPSSSGRGQPIARCPKCQVALWSHYSLGEVASFVRVGTMDEPDFCPPDVHIFTSSKQAWVILPEGAKAYPDFYDDPSTVWRPEARERWQACIALARSKAAPMA